MHRLRRLTFRVAAAIAAPSAVALTLAMAGAAGPAQAASTGSRPIAGTRPAWADSARYVGPAPSASSLTTQVYLAGDSAGLAAYAQAEDLINIGAYVKGANPNYPFGPILPLPWEQKNLPDPSASP